MTRTTSNHPGLNCKQKQVLYLMEKNFQWPHLPSLGHCGAFLHLRGMASGSRNPTTILELCAVATGQSTLNNDASTTVPLNYMEISVFYIATIVIALKKWCPFNRRQNWWSDVAFLTVMGRLFQICGAATRRVRAAVSVVVDGIVSETLFEDRRDRVGRYSRWVHVNTVVVVEIEPCMLSQQSCTEFVVRSEANPALYEALEMNSGVMHCTPLAQVYPWRAVNGWYFCSRFRIALLYGINWLMTTQKLASFSCTTQITIMRLSMICLIAAVHEIGN